MAIDKIEGYCCREHNDAYVASRSAARKADAETLTDDELDGLLSIQRHLDELRGAQTR